MEEWRTCVYNGEVWHDYEVSSLGNVRNAKTGRILKPFKSHSGHGYLRIQLCKNGKRQQCSVHRIVAFTWIVNDNPTVKTVVNHIDENPYNNHVSNLEWTTLKQNSGHGTCQKRRAKKRSKKVKCVETGQIFESTMEVERVLGLPHTNIVDCCNGKRETCGKCHWLYVD